MKHVPAALTLAGLFGIACVLGACDRFDTASRTELASNAEWKVIAVGDLRVAGPSLGGNLVRFEAVRGAEIYAAGMLYDAGPNDLPFDVEYRRVEWAASNVLRLWRPLESRLPPIHVTIRNDATVPIRWLRAHMRDLILVLDLGPGATRTATTLSGGALLLVMAGEFEDGRAIEHSATIEEGSRNVIVVVASEAVSVAAAR